MIDGRHVVCGLALALSMCGGYAEKPPAAPSPANESPGAPPPPAMAAPPPAAPAPYSQPAPAEEPASRAESAASAPPPREAQRAAAREEVDRSERSLQASLGDCTLACRALDSMDRAVTHLCALVDAPSDQRRCDDARQRLAVARRRVRDACGACSN